MTFRLVAQCLNQLRHRVPPSCIVHFLIVCSRRKSMLLIKFVWSFLPDYILALNISSYSESKVILYFYVLCYDLRLQVNTKVRGLPSSSGLSQNVEAADCSLNCYCRENLGSHHFCVTLCVLLGICYACLHVGVTFFS